MDTVIEAFIAAIEDETRHGTCWEFNYVPTFSLPLTNIIICLGETILALPDGIKIEPRINLWGKFSLDWKAEISGLHKLISKI